VYLLFYSLLFLHAAFARNKPTMTMTIIFSGGNRNFHFGV